MALSIKKIYQLQRQSKDKSLFGFDKIIRACDEAIERQVKNEEFFKVIGKKKIDGIWFCVPFIPHAPAYGRFLATMLLQKSLVERGIRAFRVYQKPYVLWIEWDVVSSMNIPTVKEMHMKSMKFRDENQRLLKTRSLDERRRFMELKPEKVPLEKETTQQQKKEEQSQNNNKKSQTPKEAKVSTKAKSNECPILDLKEIQERIKELKL